VRGHPACEHSPAKVMLTVLIVDDDASIREMVADVLALEG
jgi:CheY-like chemotaxis protein